MSDVPEVPEGELRTAIANGVTPEAALRAAATSVLVERTRLARVAGLSFGGDRDLYATLGYPDYISASEYRGRYARGGVAGRIVDAFPKATWRGGVELVEDDDPKVTTEFEKQWVEMEKRLSISSTFLKADVLAGLSYFSVILIGAPGDFNTPLPIGSPDQLLYLQPFLGAGPLDSRRRNSGTVSDALNTADATISSFVQDTKDKRFGRPEFYQLRRTNMNDPEFQRPVHWSRIIHIAEGCLDTEVYGAPALERVWNLLDDLDKVTGGGAEAFWLRANQGLQLDIDKDMTMSEPEKAALRLMAEEYQHGISRMMRTRGVTVNPLGSDVANFGPPGDAILTQISGAKAIPKRILTGSEMGELASSQDRENWRDQVNGRRSEYAGPLIVRQLVDRLIEFRYIVKPTQYDVKFSDINTRTEEEKSKGASEWAGTNSTQGTPVFTSEEIRDYWYGFPPLTPEEIKKATPPPPEPPPGAEKPEPKAASAMGRWAAHPEFTSRYDVFGPPNGCAGMCEGTGWVPVFRDIGSDGAQPVQSEESAELIDLWNIAEAEDPSSDGWHFVKCPQCTDRDAEVEYRETAQEEHDEDPDEEMVSVLAAALQSGNHDVVEAITGLGGPGSGRYPKGSGQNPQSGMSEDAGQSAIRQRLALEGLEADLDAQPAYVTPIQQDGNTHRLSVRYYGGVGNWEMPEGEEDDGDYDWKVPSEGLRARVNAIVENANKRQPSVKLSWQYGEKYWMYFEAEPRPQMKGAGGPGSGRYPKGSGGSSTSDLDSPDVREDPRWQNDQGGREDILGTAKAAGLNLADMEQISKWVYGNGEGEELDLADPTTEDGKKFDALLERLPDYTGTTYRGMGVTASELEKIKTEGVASDGRVISASSYLERAMDIASINVDDFEGGGDPTDRSAVVVLKIKGVGKHIAPFAPADYDEGEVVYRGGRFVPTGKVEIQQTTDYKLPFHVIDVEWQPAGLQKRTLGSTIRAWGSKLLERVLGGPGSGRYPKGSGVRVIEHNVNALDVARIRDESRVIAMELGFDPDKVFVTTTSRGFMVGDNAYDQGGFYSPVSGQVTVVVTEQMVPLSERELDRYLRPLIAHEITHDAFQRKIMNGKHLSQEVSEEFVETLINNYDDLSSSDGITAYSRAYWKVAIEERGKTAYTEDDVLVGQFPTNWLLAVNETLAEISAVRARSPHVRRETPIHPLWSGLHADLMAAYKKDSK